MGSREVSVCPLCGTVGARSLFAERGHELRACPGCELLFISPYPERVSDAYERVTEDTYEDLDVLDAADYHAAATVTYDRWFPFIEEECRGARSLLDVGCGTGALLERFRSVPGMRRAGIELNRGRAMVAARVAGCEIHQVPIEQLRTSEQFDVILMMDVLSHIPYFDHFSIVRSLLSERGKLVIKTGEVGSDVRKSDAHDWGIPGHLHFLGLRTVNQICARYGYRVAKHVRIPLSKERFSREAFRARGRSRLRNLLKSVLLYTPFALPLMARLDEAMRGRRLFTAFIVLTPLEPGADAETG